jgi:hypothetical protein
VLSTLMAPGEPKLKDGWVLILGVWTCGRY